jgi:hypothetical protein
MKYLKNFKIFESLESKIDLSELESILIDFKQMGLDPDVKTGSSIVVDWNLVNDVQTGRDFKSISSSEVDKYTKSRTSNSLSIEFDKNELHTYNLEETKEAYEMLKSYLYDEYNLIPNYIYINFHWNYSYFENFDNLLDKLKADEVSNQFKGFSVDARTPYVNIGGSTYFKAHKLIFGFYLA